MFSGDDCVVLVMLLSPVVLALFAPFVKVVSLIVLFVDFLSFSGLCCSLVVDLNLVHDYEILARMQLCKPYLCPW